MIHVDVKPEIEQRFAEAARAHGMTTDEYVSRFLASVAPVRPRPISADEMLNGFRALAEHATAVPNYPADFFTREMIYGEHD